MLPIRSLAEQWLSLDRDETTRKEIEDLLAEENASELEARLRERITFGTAGLRSSMKAGFAHMNSVTVLQASQGLAQYILDQTPQHAGHQNPALQIVIGHDARTNSEKFARLAAAAFLAKGFRVLWFGRLIHTPMVPFSVRYYKAAAGVMVTASHNPKNDNGYKVYWSNGCQIIPPHDKGIASAIETQQAIVTWDTQRVDNDSMVSYVFDSTTEAYFSSIQSLTSAMPSGKAGIHFMYTPMHGTGLPFMSRAMEILGLASDMQVVRAQADPDPDFPTVPFPNPEEKGALDLAKMESEKANCRLIIANDPDADRFAAAERLENGRWHQFSGNQMGVLLASYVLEGFKSDRTKLAMLASSVSSRMLASMAKMEGFLFKETLTGFKWLGNVAQDLSHQGYAAAFAYEEAIGYMFPSVVWDKDGIAAAAVFLSACRYWQERSCTPWQRLQELYLKYGYFEDANTYLISPSPETTTKVFADIRKSDSGSRPQSVGGRTILRWRDLTLGYDSATSDSAPDLPIDPSAQMITCELEDVVFTARGSGTEPKIKLYVEAKAATSEEATNIAQMVLKDLLKEWFRPEYGLKLAGT